MYLSNVRSFIENESTNKTLFEDQQQVLRAEIQRKVSEALPSLQEKLCSWRVDLIGQALSDAHQNKFEDGFECRTLRYIAMTFIIFKI